MAGMELPKYLTGNMNEVKEVNNENNEE